MAGMCRYLLDSCTLEGVPFSYTMQFSTDTSYIFCEKNGYLWLLEEAQNCLGTWDSHLYHCSNITLRFNIDVHIEHKELMESGEISQISNFALRISNFRYGGMIPTS